MHDQGTLMYDKLLTRASVRGRQQMYLVLSSTCARDPLIHHLISVPSISMLKLPCPRSLVNPIGPIALQVCLYSTRYCVLL